MNISVELDIFSGGPNPAWALTADEIKKIMNLLDALPEKERKESGDGLGYRGFRMTITPEKADNPTQTVHVFNGSISIESDTKKHYQDLHGLEKWLLSRAAAQGYGAIVDSLKSD